MLESFETTFTHHTALVNGIRLHYSLGDRLIGMMQQVAEDVLRDAVDRGGHFIPA